MVLVYLDHGICEMMMRIGCFEPVHALERGLRHLIRVRVGAAYGIVIAYKDPISPEANLICRTWLAFALAMLCNALEMPHTTNHRWQQYRYKVAKRRNMCRKRPPAGSAELRCSR
jgi:hypothetical protein